MLTSVRSVRVTTGRTPRRAHSSMSGWTGKQKRYSAPSALRIVAVAAAAFIGLPPSFVGPGAIIPTHRPGAAELFRRDVVRLIGACDAKDRWYGDGREPP